MQNLLSKNELISNLIQGKVVSFPTDTVPALAVLPDHVNLIYSLKRRSFSKPLILMADCFEKFVPYIQGSDFERILWLRMSQKYWPGALTMVLPASDKLPDSMKAKTIGLRIPNHPEALTILTQLGCLATTSANLSGKPPLEKMRDIASIFPTVSVLNYHHSLLSTGVPSTVVKWMVDGWEVLRQGQIYLD